MGEAFFVLRRHKNVFFEVSGIPPTKLLEYFPRLAQLAHKTVWGTDWPHPALGESPMPDDGALLASLADWAGDAATLRRILVDNPAALYDFP